MEMAGTVHVVTDPGARPRGPDRRVRHPLLSHWKWALRGRRRTVRRAEDRDDAYLDWYPPRLVAVCVAILALSGADATMTLWLLQTGAVIEANPVMRFLIEHDVQLFVNLKTAITGAALLFLVVSANARFLRTFRVRRILYGVLGLYMLLIGWELYMLSVTGVL